MVPETCDPTCTEVTALIVPVASTTERISPRSTLAVKYWVRSLRPSPKAANTTTAITATARISHLLLSSFNRELPFRNENSGEVCDTLSHSAINLWKRNELRECSKKNLNCLG